MQEHIRIKNNTQKSPGRESGHSTRRSEQIHPLLKLQRSLGNRALLRLRSSLGTLQTKLSLGQPHDIYEQEADTVARRIVNQISQIETTFPAKVQNHGSTEMRVQRQDELEDELAMRPSADIQRQEVPEEELALRPSDDIQRQEVPEEELAMRPSADIQRQEEREDELVLKPSDDIQRQVETEEEEEEEAVQTKSNEGSQSGGALPISLENQVQQQRQGGDSMDSFTRAQMENGFGYDFGQVKIHNDSTADNVSQQLNAEAFTLNNDIFFRHGRYNPSSTQGQDLLAHELTHVVQQGAAADLKPELTKQP